MRILRLPTISCDLNHALGPASLLAQHLTTRSIPIYCSGIRQGPDTIKDTQDNKVGLWSVFDERSRSSRSRLSASRQIPLCISPARGVCVVCLHRSPVAQVEMRRCVCDSAQPAKLKPNVVFGVVRLYRTCSDDSFTGARRKAGC